MMRPQTIHLGYEDGTGLPVAIPLQHLAVTGQTRLSGKTTTLEALVTRAGLPAITFITKRHEGGFANARQVPPYFREKADWTFVASVLEATLREKMRFERPWIMRVCKGAMSLRDVQYNVREAMRSAKGLAADVYLTLDHYLDIVVPQVAGLPIGRWAPIEPGVNVMDLTEYPTEVQGLVIRSVLEYVYINCTNTLVVIPEAWEFIPQNRGSPVLYAAEQLIRKGGAGGNFVWLDSQDIAGVHKNILRQVGVWLLGVQREINEIKRTLSHIPAGVRKPTPDMVRSLGIGHFVAAFDRRVTITYVQPAWMPEATAIAISKGETPLESMEGQTVNEQEAAELRAENAQLKGEVSRLQLLIEEMTRAPAPVASDSPPLPRTVPEQSDKLIAIDDDLYEALKQRLLEDQVVLALLSQRREIEVRVERRVLQVDGATTKGRIARLISEGFFDAGATNSGTRTELKRTGADANNATIARVLNDLKADGFLTEEGDRFRAVVGMKVHVVDAGARHAA
ncbi:type IV pilus assembly protein FimV [Bradyrhizobium paxllaeri]|uniref:type IV pilus assembly protein FimV n=1 Tax=Bradyrhizobium paxllaeri TaxID=190148 RepID=UPI000827795D|nr:ATP-binding protein [Bradyrhizobium paxllaeri]